MKGVRFVINLKANPAPWEDIYDRSLAPKRSAEPRESLAGVKRRLEDRNGRRAHG